jgi:hypothetical protein
MIKIKLFGYKNKISSHKNDWEKIIKCG